MVTKPVLAESVPYLHVSIYLVYEIRKNCDMRSICKQATESSLFLRKHCRPIFNGSKWHVLKRSSRAQASHLEENRDIHSHKQHYYVAASRPFSTVG